MLAPVPCQAPVKEGKEESKKNQENLGSGGKSDTESGEIDLSSPEDRAKRDIVFLLLAGGKGPHQKIGRGSHLRGARCHQRVAWVWAAMPLNSSSKGTSPRPNRKRI